MPSPQKVVAVAYDRFSFTRGSYYRALTGKNLVFWIGGRLGEVVAHRGSTVGLVNGDFCGRKKNRES